MRWMKSYATFVIAFHKVFNGFSTIIVENYFHQ